MKAEISGVINSWLEQEVVDSRHGNNRVLDNFQKSRNEFLPAQDNEANPSTGKHSSHYGRFQHLINSMKRDPGFLKDDFGAGRVVHHALMFASGGFRGQCFLEAGSQDDYERLRFDSGRSHGIDLEQTVGQAIDLLGSNTASGVLDYSLALNDSVDADHSSISRWFSRNPSRSMDALSPEEPPVLAMLRKQRAAVAIATGNILLSAELRGGLEAVPLLEPKSISSVGPPIYPFAS